MAYTFNADTGTINVTATSGTTLVVDTNVFVVDASNNRVGINNASPTQALDVTGKGLFSDIIGLPQIATGSLPSAVTYEGYIAYDSTTNEFKYANGTSWVAPGGGMSIGGAVTSGTTGSLLFVGSGSVLAQDNANLFWDDTNNRLGIGTATPAYAVNIVLPATDSVVIDGRTNPRDISIGVFRINHTPATTSTRPITLDIDMNNQADTRAMVVDYRATGLSAGEESSGYNVTLDTANSTGGNFSAFHVSKVGTGTATVDALEIHGGINVVKHKSGTPASFDNAWTLSGVTYTDVTTAFGSTGTDVQIFAADNDYIIVGHANKFAVIEANLAIVSSNNIRPIFEFSNGSGGWVVFTPSDGTNGFTVNGNITWEPDDLTGWATDTVNGVGSKYWVRIQRTRNSLTTPPTEDYIKAVVVTPYVWDSSGNVNLNQLSLSGVFTSTAASGNTLVIDTNTLVVDATNNRVGIGTTSPSYTLNVVGTIASDIFTAHTANVTNNLTFNSRITSGGSSYTAFLFNNPGTTLTTGNIVQWQTNSVQRAGIDYQGAFTTNFGLTGLGTVSLTYTSGVAAAGTAHIFKTSNTMTSGGVIGRWLSNATVLSEIDWRGNTTITGPSINTEADGVVAWLTGSTSITKNDANTRQFYGIKLKPTLNTGGSNTTTTLDILHVDTTNTATTGLTTNLMNLQYGGTSRFKVVSNGEVNVNGSAGTSGQVLTSAGAGAPPTWTTPGNVAYTAKTTTYTATTSDYVIECTSGTFTVTLPTAVGNTGKVLIIKNSGTGSITIDGDGSETIDGATTLILSMQNDSATLVANGANWIVV